MRLAPVPFALLSGLILTPLASGKDNFQITFALAGNQEAERINDVDQDKFQGNRLGFGVFIESERFKKRFSVESGAYKTNRQYTVVESSSTIAEEVERLHVPALARYYPWEFISLGVGAYGAFSVSNQERAVESNAQVGESTSAEAAEYGGLASVAFYLGKTSGPRLVLDLRWHEPFDPEKSEQTNNLTTFVGAKIEI